MKETGARATLTGTPQAGSSRRSSPTSICRRWIGTSSESGSIRPAISDAPLITDDAESRSPLIRYADDFVILVRRAREQAEAVRDEAARYSATSWRWSCQRRRPSSLMWTSFDFLGIGFEAPGARASGLYVSEQAQCGGDQVQVKNLTTRSTTHLASELLLRVNSVLRGWQRTSATMRAANARIRRLFRMWRSSAGCGRNIPSEPIVPAKQVLRALWINDDGVDCPARQVK